MPKQPVEYFASSRPVNGENLIAIHDQNYENKVYSKDAKGDCLPLCFSSFERMKRRFRVTNKKQELEIMDEAIGFLEMDNEKDEKSCNQSHHEKKPIVCNAELNHI